MATPKSSKMPARGLVIDWETSGSLWGGDSSIDYQGISYGAAIFDMQTFEPLKQIYREIKFDAAKYKWSAEAEAIHGRSREVLETNGVSQEEAACDLADFILSDFGPEPTIMVLGHNRDFDIAFTKQLLEPLGLMFKVHHVHLDTSGLGLLTIGIYKSELLFQAMGLPERTQHNALEDALYTLETAKRIRMIFNAGMGL